MRQMKAMASLALLFVLCGPVLADTVDSFPLTKAAPEDVYLVVGGRHNPKREFLDKYWAGVFAAFHKSGVTDEVWELITEQASKEQMTQLEDAIDRCHKLIDGITWGDLCGREFAFMSRVNMPIWDQVFLSRNTPESVERNFTGFRGVFAECRKTFGESLTIEDTEMAGAKVCSLKFAGAPFALSVAKRGDVLALALGESLLRDALALLAGKADVKSMASTARFRSAFSKLPAADDSIVFFDVARMMSALKSQFNLLEKQMAPQPVRKVSLQDEDEDKPKHKSDDGDKDDDENGDDEKSAAKHGGGHGKHAGHPQHHGEDKDEMVAMFHVFGAIIDDMSIWDYVAVTEHTDGYRVFTESFTALTADAKSRPAYKIFCSGGAIERFDQFVPREAVGFSVREYINFTATYDWLESFIRDRVPEGDKILTQWEAIQDEHEFHVKKDLLSWLQGPIGFVSLPGGMGRHEGALFVGVSDAKAASKQIHRLVTCINDMLGEQQHLIVQDVEIGGQKFQAVSHPFFMMMQLKPIVWGTQKGWLMFATSEKTMASCLKCSAKTHPSILKSARFMKEGIVPTGPVVSASFEDTSRTAEELSAALTGATMALGMVTTFAQIPDEQGGKIIKAIPSICGKLVKVVSKLNFFQSESAATTFDGKGWRSTRVENYKDPATIKESESDNDEESADDDQPIRRHEHGKKADKEDGGHSKKHKQSDDDD